MVTEVKTMESLLRKMMERKASDLHVSAGSPPIYRVFGHLVPDSDAQPLNPESVRELIASILDAEQRGKFDRDMELDFSYSIPGLSRFRCNVYFQRGTMGAVFRAIPDRPLTLDELGLSNLKSLIKKPRGIILVTGPTGSGKSTTLAAMIDHLNETDEAHIVTIEDPIEFLHKNKKSIVRQRELGDDTLGFPAALKHVLRQDPDVIMVGEMRDLETISLAVTAAETGHLVFGTLHTTSAAQTVDRIVDVFPPHQQSQIRMQVAGSLELVTSQTLVPRADGTGRVCAVEILVGTTGVRSLIREGKTQQIPSLIQTGGQLGMQSLDAALKKLVQDGTVKPEDAAARATNAEEFKRALGR